MIKVDTFLGKRSIEKLKVGDRAESSGTIYTARD